MVSTGWEAEYTGINDLSLVESNEYVTYSVYNEGFVMGRYSLWGFAHLREEDWNDEILNTIGTGRLSEPSFHTGCWIGGGTRSTHPCHVDSMKLIDDVLTGYLDGKSEEEFIAKYPHYRD